MGPGLAYGEGPRLAVGYYFSPMTSGLSEGGAHEPGLLLPRFSGGGQRRGWVVHQGRGHDCFAHWQILGPSPLDAQ